MGLFPKLRIYSIGLMAAAFCSSAAFAKVTLLGTPTGTSAVITTTSGDAANPTTTLTIYAGFAGTCTATDGVAICNSCLGAPIVDGGGTTFTTSPCNFRNAYNSLKLHIELTVNNSAVTGTPNLFLVVNTKNLAGSSSYTYTGTTLAVDIPWSDICGASGTSTDCTTQSLSDEIEIGVKGVTGGTGTGTDDTMTIPFKTRALSVVSGGAANDTTNWFYQDCPPAGLAGKSNEGFCHFTAYKGDSKVYADELGVPGTYPTAPQSVKYTSLVFFYEEQTGGETDAQTVARITTKSRSSVIAVNTTLKPPASDNRVTGLTNGSRYCFVMANQDASGVISYFTPTQTTTPTPVLVASLCGTPEKVVGLLDDKSCFIATAAFGSDMAPEVQSFRDFRNEYLFSSSAGKEFVRIYYKYSPFYANLIAQNDVARATVRLALWPLLLFAKVSVNFGLWVGILFAMSTLGLLVLACRRLKVLRPSRNEDRGPA